MDTIIDLATANEEQEDTAEEEYETALQATATIIAGIEIARQSRIEARHPNRLYLCRSQLLPDPRGDTPWLVSTESAYHRHGSPSKPCGRHWDRD